MIKTMLRKVSAPGSVLLFLLIAGCASGPAGMERPPEMTDAEATERALLDEYVVGVGDGLQVNVWRNPDLTVAMAVLPDGRISVPLAGSIVAAGKTTEALSEEIRESLAEYIREPQVSVTVVSAQSARYLRRIRVTGAVNAPQSLPYSRGMTVVDVILASGGLSEFARGNDALLYRRDDGVLRIFPLELERLLHRGDLTTNYHLLPGDIISVPEGNF